MSFGVFCAVLAAAALHVLWNSIIRHSTNKNSIMLFIVAAQGLVGFPFILLWPVPEMFHWGWIIASGFTHFFYQTFLLKAYHYGDLSRVYPIARGAAPMFLLLLNPLILHEALQLGETIGTIVIAGGIVLLSWGAWQQQEALKLLPFALGSAACTAAYSIIDSLGARQLDNVLLYKGWSMLLCSGLWIGWNLLFSPGHFAGLNRKMVSLGLFAGAISFAAYAVVLWAMTQSPIALVSALRETSVLLAVLVGVTFFGEKWDKIKLLSVIIIFLGAVLTRLA